MAIKDDLAERWNVVRTALDVQERVRETNGGATASATTVMFFVAIFPLLLVAIAVLGFISAGNEDFATDVIENLGLEGAAADNMTSALETAQNSRQAASIIGVLGLLWSGLGVTTALSLAVRTPWQRKVPGLKAKAFGLVWLLGGVVTFGGAVASGALLNRTPEVVPRVVTSAGLVVLGLFLEMAFFLWTFWILGDRRAGWRALLPGAVVGAIGFEILKVAGTVLVPRMVASSSSIYGPLGIVFAVLAWLTFFSRLVVYCSAINAVRYEAEHGSVTLTISALRFPDEVAVTADRGGAVVDPEPEAEPDDDDADG